ncbi:MAG: GNAT family N-acetyltransferase [Anaerolineae bacterium]
MKQQILPDTKIRSICLHHFYESLTCFSVLPDVEVTSSDTLIQVISPDIPNWLTNAVFKINLEPEDIEQQIDSITTNYRTKQVAPFWRICPDDYPTNIDHQLLAAGYEKKTQHILMSIQIDTMGLVPTSSINTRLEVITSASALHEKHLSFRQIDDNGSKSFTTLMRDLFDFHGYEQDSRWLHYVALQGDKPIGYASAFYTANAVGIYNVGVIPEARRKGIATALTIQALQDARERGYKIGTLQSSEMAHSMYKKIGFETHFPIQYFAPA